MVDLVVVGGGHAGVEAAAAAARCGASVILLTFDRNNLGTLSCNPSIGGVGKGHIVREIDAFDGLMARAADHAGIHYRMLNASKGAAVHGPRVQADRQAYARFICAELRLLNSLSIVEGEASSLQIDGGRITGVRLTDGSVLPCRAVVLATGTFLGARMFRGDEREAGGRIGERPATAMAAQLRELDLPIGRLKTGTPPRLDGRTIDWARLVPQPSDVADWTMSPMSAARRLPQVACALTRTTPETHDRIRADLHRSPLIAGAIEAGGPRYCPSIEDKITRFGDRDGHQIFLEPEGLADATVYPNGISTSLPTDVQERIVASIPGLENARITVPGYAVEYDYLDPRALDARLALTAIDGLFCAGQINGTTGYEEAAGQGLVAGINAAAHATGRAPLTLDRASSYIGVMIDDLVLQGVTEPYRMLTARAEYRLSLRADNAETRLSHLAERHGCLSPARIDHVRRREERRRQIIDGLLRPLSASALPMISQDGSIRSRFDWLRFDGIDPSRLLDGLGDTHDPVVAEVVQDARYAPYVERQALEIERLRQGEADLLPADLCYQAIPGLSHEMVERLTQSRPMSIAAAGRIRGITPAALSAIMLYNARKAA